MRRAEHLHAGTQRIANPSSLRYLMRMSSDEGGNQECHQLREAIGSVIR